MLGLQGLEKFVNIYLYNLKILILIKKFILRQIFKYL